MNKKNRKLSRRAFGQQVAMSTGGLLQMGSGSLLAGAATPRQTEGPFYPDSDVGDKDLDLTLIKGHTEAAKGDPIYVYGQVLDTDGQPLANATVDVWQANDAGKYRHADDPNPAPLDPNFQGWGIVQTDALGFYRYKTIVPGSYPLEALGEGGGRRARHIHYKVSHEGHKPITTQLYFPGDPLIEQDLEIVKAPAEDQWMMISVEEEPHVSGIPIYRFDVVLAGMG
jgi:protocatechuate 3,4-dioxygenase beta subunit